MVAKKLGHIGVRHLCDMYIIKMTDILSMPVISLEYQWSVAHAARGRDGRQEGRERRIVMGTGTHTQVLG